jgi:hypothetical protein
LAQGEALILKTPNQNPPNVQEPGHLVLARCARWGSGVNYSVCPVQERDFERGKGQEEGEEEVEADEGAVSAAFFDGFVEDRFPGDDF